jgi:putative transcriptional regulator
MGNDRVSAFDNLEGHLLIAMPGMTDERFMRAVIYICEHSARGAMGIVVNKPASDLRLPDLLVQLEIIGDDDAIRLPDTLDRIPVLMGGPVETSRGFVLHSPDYRVAQSSRSADRSICLTSTVDILRAIARGHGPRNALLALGYAGWSAGQLENEIQRNGWLNCPADPDVVFGHVANDKYERALRLLGIDPGLLSSSAGHA